MMAVLISCYGTVIVVNRPRPRPRCTSSVEEISSSSYTHCVKVSRRNQIRLDRYTEPIIMAKRG